MSNEMILHPDIATTPDTPFSAHVGGAEEQSASFGSINTINDALRQPSASYELRE
jgi:hypothetical protein